MKSELFFKDRMECSIEVTRPMVEKAIIKTVWDFECFDKHGNLKWRDVQRPNIVTTEALNALLNVMIHGYAQLTKWYLFPVESNTTAVATMTYAVPTFTECIAYEQTSRVLFNGNVSTAKSISNTDNKAIFTMNAEKTLYGAALVGGFDDEYDLVSSKRDVSDEDAVLFSYAKFSSSKLVESSDSFRILCTLTSA